MQEAFVIILFGVVLIGLLVALASLFGSSDLYDRIGRGGLSIDEEKGRGGAADRPPGGGASPMAPVSEAVRQEEIRQMLDARNARREARGQAALDVDEEVARLSAPALDEGVREEVRALVRARNARLRRRGRPELDVETEVDRRMRELGG